MDGENLLQPTGLDTVAALNRSCEVFGYVDVIDSCGRVGLYKGSMRNGLAHGVGTCMYQRNGIFLPYRYEGEYLAGKKHGQGKLFWGLLSS